MSSPVIYASTACLKGTVQLKERINLYREHGITDIELGANVDVQNFQVTDLPKDGRYMIHNYFPPPAEPFILNMASAKADIRKKSLELATQGIKLSAEMGAKAYTVHSGFTEDPGFDFEFPRIPSEKDKAESLTRFIETISDLIPIAEDCGVRLLLENNVCTVPRKGYFLLQTTNEFQEFFDVVTSKTVGILVDTGHLNVSAKTFGFDRMEFVETLAPRIGAFHLHENDGDTDQHLPVTPGSWVTEILRMPVFSSAAWIMEAKFPHPDGVFEQLLFLRKIAAEKRI